MYRKLELNRIFCFLMTLATVVLICSCGTDDKPDYQMYDSLWIQSHTSVEPVENFDFVSLKSYYYESIYYYEVMYRLTIPDDMYPPDKVFDFLYVFKNQSLSTCFSVSHPEQCERYYPDRYEHFLQAKEKGIMRDYSPDEIKQIINNYCTPTEAVPDD